MKNVLFMILSVALTAVVCMSLFVLMNDAEFRMIDLHQKYFDATEKVLDKIPHHVIDSVLTSPEGDKYMDAREKIQRMYETGS
jgi:hypothetical protein